MSEENDKDLELAQKLFSFLQGEMPEDISVSRRYRPKLTPDQAWCVVWFLGNQYRQVSDAIERCDVCGRIYHSWQEGYCLDYGKPPYFFCESCMETEEFSEKQKSPLNPLGLAPPTDVTR